MKYKKLRCSLCWVHILNVGKCFVQQKEKSSFFTMFVYPPVTYSLLPDNDNDIGGLQKSPSSSLRRMLWMSSFLLNLKQVAEERKKGSNSNLKTVKIISCPWEKIPTMPISRYDGGKIVWTPRSIDSIVIGCFHVSNIVMAKMLKTFSACNIIILILIWILTLANFRLGETIDNLCRLV